MDCYWDVSRGLINPGWVTWARVYDVARPETPNDPRIHHWGCVPVHPWDVSCIVNAKQYFMMKLILFLVIRIISWWTGVVWIIVMFLSDSHSDGTHSLQSIHWLSFWRHPFTAEHPLLRHISPNLMKKQTHPNLGWHEGESVISNFSCLLNYSFKTRFIKHLNMIKQSLYLCCRRQIGSYLQHSSDVFIVHLRSGRVGFEGDLERATHSQWG